MGSICVNGLNKAYKYYPTRWSRLAEWLLPSRKPRHTLKQILKDINFEVQPGEAVGIIGVNGAGKSTLLKLITGTIQPTSGSVKVTGRVAAILELGMGFHPDFTGRQNAIMAGQLLGLTADEITTRMPEIEAFADIGDYIEQPVRIYSSGMMMRLAFAVEVLCDPDILIIDEAMSVGDFFFQQKCLGHIRKLCAKGVTLLFISHDMGTVSNLCSRVLYLRGGKLFYNGPAAEGITLYYKEKNTCDLPLETLASNTSMEKTTTPDTIRQDALWTCKKEDRQKAGKLIAIALYDKNNKPTTSFVMGERIRIAVEYRSDAAIPTHITIGFSNKYDQLVSMTGSAQLGIQPPAPTASSNSLIFEAWIDMTLEAGNYAVVIGMGYLTGVNWGEQIDKTPALGPIQLIWEYEKQPAPFIGLCGLPTKGEFRIV